MVAAPLVGDECAELPMPVPTADPLVRNPGQLKDLVGKIAARALSPVDLVQDCLDRISEVDGQVMAWTQVDGELALAEARQCEL